MKKVAVGLLILLIGAGLAGAADVGFEQQGMRQIAQAEQCQPTEKNYVVTVKGTRTVRINGKVGQQRVTEEISVVATSVAEAKEEALRAFRSSGGQNGRVIQTKML